MAAKRVVARALECDVFRIGTLCEVQRSALTELSTARSTDSSSGMDGTSSVDSASRLTSSSEMRAIPR